MYVRKVPDDSGCIFVMRELSFALQHVNIDSSSDHFENYFKTLSYYISGFVIEYLNNFHTKASPFY